MIILPDNPLFHATLSNPPPEYKRVAKETGNTNLVANYESGILSQVDDKALIEYLYGGEYDLVEQANDEYFGELSEEIIWY